MYSARNHEAEVRLREYVDNSNGKLYIHRLHFDALTAGQRALQTQAIHIRASSEQKALIDRAARRLGISRTQFVLDTAREAAERVLLDQRLLIVDKAIYDAFNTLLDAPIEADDGLRRTLNTPPPWGT